MTTVDLRVDYPQAGLDPDDYASVELVLKPALAYRGSQRRLREAMGSFTHAQYTLFAIHSCYRDVLKGGFFEYFWYAGLEEAHDALQAFDEVEMRFEAMLFRQALEHAPAGDDPGNLHARLRSIGCKGFRACVASIEDQWFQLAEGPENVRKMVSFMHARKHELFKG
jgi:hypothetical protein